MAATIQITDGTDTVTLRTFENGWSPSVTTRSDKANGQRYVKVQERMDVFLEAADAATLLSDVTTLLALMDKATAWGKGSTATPVYCKVLMDGSSVTVQAPMEKTGVQLPANYATIGQFSSTVLGLIDDPITLSFTRLGLWLSTATEAESSSASTGNPAILTTTTFSASAAVLSPYDIKVDTELLHPSAEMYVLGTNDPTKAWIGEGEDGVNSAGGALGSAVVSEASAGEVAQWSSVSTEQIGYWLPFASFNANIRKVLVLAVVRLQTSSRTLQVKANLCQLQGSSTERTDGYDGRVKTIADTNINLVNLGIISVPDSLQEGYQLRLYLTPSGGAATFDVDYLAVFGIDDNAAIWYISDGQNWLDVGGSVPVLDVYIDHRLDTARTPICYGVDSGPSAFYNPSRYNHVPMMTGNQITVLVVGKTPSDWVLRQSISDVECNLTLTATRTLAYLSPP